MSRKNKAPVQIFTALAIIAAVVIIIVSELVIFGFLNSSSMPPITQTVPLTHANLSESGLPSGIIWATLNGVPVNSSSVPFNSSILRSTISIYNVSINGTLYVSNVSIKNSSLSVTFTKYNNSNKLITTISESGLPNGTEWIAVYDGVISSSNTENIFVPTVSGNFSFLVYNITLNSKTYVAVPSSGNLSAGSQKLITFTTNALESQNVITTFYESGLPSYYTWYVTYNGYQSYNLTPDSISFTTRSGIYSYSVETPGVLAVKVVAGASIDTCLTTWAPSPSSGSVSAGSSQIITFSCVPEITEFKEVGLPAGHVWSVTYNGSTNYAAAPSDITFSLISKSVYSYSVFSQTSYNLGCTTYYYPNPLSGTLASGSNETITFNSFAYCPSTSSGPRPSPTTTFTEIGLPASKEWSVTYNGTRKSTNTTISNISVGALGTSLGGIAITPNSQYAYVSDPNGNAVVVVSLSTNTVITNISINKPTFITITPNGKYAYVSDPGKIGPSAPAQVVVINLSSNTIIDNITFGGAPGEIAITPDGEYAYVVNTSSDSVVIINTSTNIISGNITLTGTPGSIVITPNGKYAYVSDPGLRGPSNFIYEFNLSTNTLIANISFANEPSALAITPNGEYIYASISGEETVSVVNTTTNTIIANLTVGNESSSIAMSPNGQYAYVANEGSGTLSVINTSANAVISNSSVGRGPYAIAATPNGEYVYIAFNTSWVSALSTGIEFSWASSAAYAYSVFSPPNSTGGCTTSYSPVPSSGTLALGSTQSIRFTPSTACNITYFVESGLPNGTTWWVDYDGINRSSSSNKDAFSVAQSAYPYSVGNATYILNITPILVGSGPQGITYDSDNGDVYVSSVNTNTVSVINSSNKVTATIPVGVQPQGIAYDPANGEVYVADYRNNTLSVLTPLSLTTNITTMIPAGSWPYAMVYDPLNEYLYVTNQFNNSVTVINKSNDIVTTVGVGYTPSMIAYDPVNGYVYVGNINSMTVSVINGSNNVIATVPVFGANLESMAFDSGNGEMYVASNYFILMHSEYFAYTDFMALNRSNDVVLNISFGPLLDAATMVYDPVYGDMYVGFQGVGLNDIYILNQSNDLSLVPYLSINTPFASVYDPENGYVYILAAGGENGEVDVTEPSQFFTPSPSSGTAMSKTNVSIDYS